MTTIQYKIDTAYEASGVELYYSYDIFFVILVLYSVLYCATVSTDSIIVYMFTERYSYEI